MNNIISIDTTFYLKKVYQIRKTIWAQFLAFIYSQVPFNVTPPLSVDVGFCGTSRDKQAWVMEKINGFFANDYHYH
jgi:hypothetical protein